MPIQTASIDIVWDDAVQGTVVHVKTPDGSFSYPLNGPSFGHPYVARYEKNPEPALKKFSAKKTKRASIAQETEVMELLGGRRHPGSGALSGLKGDGRVRNKYRVEMKQTRQKGYRVDREELSKIRGECTLTEAPLFIFEFTDPRTGGSPDRWVLLPFDTFLRMDNAVTLDSGSPAPR